MPANDDDLDALFEQVAAERSTAHAIASEAENAAAAKSLTTLGLEFTPVDGSLEEGAIFDRLGNIVRTMHNAIRELGMEKQLAESASAINDAHDRLAYIAELTANAANTTLNAIDVGMPAQDSIAARAKAMSARWDAMFRGEVSLDGFKALAADSQGFAKQMAEEADAEKKRLLEIMMAQDFQDITGQIIKKVMVVHKKAESDLTQLLLDSAPQELKEKIKDKEKMADKPVDLLAGPNIPTVALAQDDVDDLLADLGF
jgi:chemotaxis protein CheZ